MFEVVSTAYQEHISATTMSGTTTREAILPTTLPLAREVSRSITAHWPTNHNSAQVATERPTTTLDTQESNRQMRGPSNTGNTERKAQPNT
jgi:hypothetical protein